jgi:hypothetical protein
MEKKIGKLETLHESMEEIKKLLTEKKSSVDASLFDSEPREPLDLHPVEFISDGTRMITAPVLLCQGDKAWWRYSADLVRSVEILKCTEPTRLRVQPIYMVNKCTNGQTHDVCHSELFITKDRATTWEEPEKSPANQVFSMQLTISILMLSVANIQNIRFSNRRTLTRANSSSATFIQPSRNSS